MTHTLQVDAAGQPVDDFDDYFTPPVRVRLVDYDRRLPCGTPSARTNHLAHAQTCTACGVEGTAP